jgi:hypothetical protein
MGAASHFVYGLYDARQLKAELQEREFPGDHRVYRQSIDFAGQSRM